MQDTLKGGSHLVDIIIREAPAKQAGLPVKAQECKDNTNYGKKIQQWIGLVVDDFQTHQHMALAGLEGQGEKGELPLPGICNRYDVICCSPTLHRKNFAGTFGGRTICCYNIIGLKT